MTSEGERRDLPVITTMPVVSEEVWTALRDKWHKDGAEFFMDLGAVFTRNSPEHTSAYDKAFIERTPPPEPDATLATVLLVLGALNMQAQSEGHRLPEVPEPINPMPALRQFFRTAQGSSDRLISVAYDAVLETNGVIGVMVDHLVEGAPTDALKASTLQQAKRGTVYAYYGVKAAMLR